jgi:hypothetical protein
LPYQKKSKHKNKENKQIVHFLLDKNKLIVYRINYNIIGGENERSETVQTKLQFVLKTADDAKWHHVALFSQEDRIFL